MEGEAGSVNKQKYCQKSPENPVSIAVFNAVINPLSSHLILFTLEVCTLGPLLGYKAKSITNMLSTFILFCVLKSDLNINKTQLCLQLGERK